MAAFLELPWSEVPRLQRAVLVALGAGAAIGADVFDRVAARSPRGARCAPFVALMREIYALEGLGLVRGRPNAHDAVPLRRPCTRFALTPRGWSALARRHPQDRRAPW
jgi:hypothetical protein